MPRVRIGRRRRVATLAWLAVVIGCATLSHQPACVLAHCEDHCSYRGTCNGDAVCACHSGFEGPKCEKRVLDCVLIAECTGGTQAVCAQARAQGVWRGRTRQQLTTKFTLRAQRQTRTQRMLTTTSNVAMLVYATTRKASASASQDLRGQLAIGVRCGLRSASRLLLNPRVCSPMPERVQLSRNMHHHV